MSIRLGRKSKIVIDYFRIHIIMDFNTVYFTYNFNLEKKI